MSIVIQHGNGRDFSKRYYKECIGCSTMIQYTVHDIIYSIENKPCITHLVCPTCQILLPTG